MTSTYRQVWDGEWEPLEKDQYIACCDCGLVHRVQIRTQNGKIQVKFTLENRRTGQLRRRNHAGGTR